MKVEDHIHFCCVTFAPWMVYPSGPMFPIQHRIGALNVMGTSAAPVADLYTMQVELPFTMVVSLLGLILAGLATCLLQHWNSTASASCLQTIEHWMLTKHARVPYLALPTVLSSSVSSTEDAQGTYPLSFCLPNQFISGYTLYGSGQCVFGKNNKIADSPQAGCTFQSMGEKETDMGSECLMHYVVLRTII